MNSDLQGAEAPTLENRRSPRRAASLVPSITSVRLSPVGGEAVLVNISATGVLVRCMTRVRTDTAVNVIFDGGFSPASVPGRVVRCVVAQIDGSGRLWFDLGIAFGKTIAFEDVPAPVETKAPAPPVQDQAKIAEPLFNRW